MSIGLSRSKRIRAKIDGSSLANQIPSLFAVSTFDAQPRDYLTDIRIRKLITRSAIEGELKKESVFFEYSEIERHDLLDWIYDKAIKVFAITLQCDPSASFLLGSMGQFYDCAFDDNSLPIDDPKPPLPAVPPIRPDAFDAELWTDFKYYRFYKEQWTCLAPIFKSAKYTYNEYSECIFPFIIHGAVPKVGAFSSVYKVEIHEDHQEFPNPRDVRMLSFLDR